ncbi:MAG: cytochrome c biogenesis protein CcdA [candidate division Zixibacteria bacterium]
MKDNSPKDKKNNFRGFFILLLMLGSVSAFGALTDLDKPWEDEGNVIQISPMLSYTSVQPGKVYPAALILDIEQGWHINSAYPKQVYYIGAELKFDTVSGLIPSDIKYPEAHTFLLLDEEMSVYDGKTAIYFNIRVADDAQSGNISLPLKFRYQPCDNKVCLAPETKEIDFIITVGDEGQPIASEIFAGIDIAEIQSNEQSDQIPQDDSELARVIEKYGFWGYFMALGLAFIAGLLLSFSPCTYPMIPITVSIFAGQDRGVFRGFIMSLFYVGSMAIMYGIMGLIVSLVGGVFGAWLANPIVVVAIAIIFVIFSLSMFGLYELNIPSSIRQKLGTAQNKGGIAGPIILGIVAALVVSPCVGPFVAGILLYIATYGSPLFGFLTLFVFAIGLGTLYIIIGTFSSSISKLPGAGEWMDQIKRFFGFILLLMALYFLKTVISPEVSAILAGLLFLALAVFGGGLDRLSPESGFFLRLKKFVGILAFIAGLYFIIGSMLSQGFIFPAVSEWMPSMNLSSSAEKHLIPWETDLQQGLDRAKTEGKPVLIDTWATWCINCRVLEKKTFNNPQVAAEAERFVPLKIQLEKADTPITKDFMARFGLKHYSLPTTLLLDSHGNVKRVMYGVVEPDDMIAEMQKIR